MKYNKSISIDLSGKSSLGYIVAMQGDTSRYLHISLNQNSKPYIIPENAEAYCRYKPPDNSQNSIEAEIKDNTVIVDLADTLSYAGHINCDIVLHDKTKKVLTCALFTLRVTKTVVDPNIAIPDNFGSDNEVCVLPTT